MGYTANTNVELVVYNPEDPKRDVLKETIDKNPIVIFDNGIGTSIEIFEGLYVEPKKLVPKLVAEAGERGGGPGQEIIQKLSDTLFNPTSGLYLPTIIVNGFLTKITVDGTIKVLKLLFNKFKTVYRRKRVKILYHFEVTDSFFEFPSDTNMEEFEKGLRDIPDSIVRSIKAKYFTRSLKKNLWIEEDIES